MRYFQSTFLAIAMLLVASVPGLANAISLPTPTETVPMRARGAEPSLSPGVEARLSNAARFQRGLGPRRPRQLYNATRAILPRTSNSPSTPYLAEVAYASEPDTVIGWLGEMLLAAGNMALFTHVGQADLFYVPDNVPATDAVLTTYSGQYTGFFTVSKTSATSSSTMFTGTATTTSESPIWDLSDFDSSGNYISMRYALGATTYKLYLYPIVDGGYTTYTLYGGESAAAINAAYSLAIPESDEVLLTLAKNS